MRELMTQAEIDADPAAWLEKRRELITATDVACILPADTAFGSPMSVYLNKTAGVKPRDRMRWILARAAEQPLADIYEGLHPDEHPGYLTKGNTLTNPGLYASDEVDWLAATFDRIEQPSGTVVEIKKWHSRDGWEPAPHGNIPLQYHVQCLVQGFVAGAKMVKLAVYFDASDTFECYWIPIDDNALEDVAYFVERATQFREDYLLPGRPPPADGHSATTVALKSLYSTIDVERVVVPKRLHDDALRAQRRVKSAELAFALAKNRIAERQGNAGLSVTRTGQPVMQRSLSWPRRIDVKRLRVEEPSIADAYTVQPAADEPEIRYLLKEPKEPR